ncbi:disulfide bond formation protein B [Pseudomonas sp. PCH199]|uniref:disulfide bond formation protein B n=1 Tax=unclassified Pseudomonas TaxID=196821 RepID=UPI000BD80073|nr:MULTISPECIES: disulfide bond formation protein B [unclassified Pseudomonas]MCW8274542.1 disulfide bond formation protein B [Pseudomonas sp. PCH199]PAM85211.1 disulfide bond formation protein B [Pseudomonas sp. ERMR1:02]
MSLACTRSLFFTVFVTGTLVLGVSYYLEYSVGLIPCGLCLLQRFCLALLVGVCLMAAVHGPGRLGSFLYWLLGLLCSLAGTVTAWRQVLLQSDPVHLSICTPNLADLFANAPWSYVVQQMFKGTIDCAQISWTLFDLSIPEWSLLFFVAMMTLGIYQLLRLVWNAVRRPLSGESSHQVLAGD